MKKLILVALAALVLSPAPVFSPALAEEAAPPAAQQPPMPPMPPGANGLNEAPANPHWQNLDAGNPGARKKHARARKHAKDQRANHGGHAKKHPKRKR